MEPEAKNPLGPISGLMAVVSLYIGAQVGAIGLSWLVLRALGSPAALSSQAFSSWIGEEVLLVTALSWGLLLPFALLLGERSLPVENRPSTLLQPSTAKGFSRGLALAGALPGVPIVFGCFLGAYLVQPASSGPEVLPLLAALIGLTVSALGEEVILRVLVLGYLLKRLGRLAAVLCSSMIFAGLHAANPESSILGLIGVFLAGAALAEMRLKSGSIYRAWGFHLGWNAIIALVAGLPVSGFLLPSIFRLEAGTGTSKELLFGGSFGPEAGLIFLGGLAGLWLSEARRPGS